MTKWGLLQGYKAGSTFKSQMNVIHHINRLQKKKHRILSTDNKKSI